MGIEFMDARTIFKNVSSVLVIDWPSRDVPEALVRAGLNVTVRSGPGPADFSIYELSNGEVVSHKSGRAPDRVDLVYCHRPIGELSNIIATARKLNAKAIWMQSGLSAAGIKDPRGFWMSGPDVDSARERVEAAGLIFISEPYIADVARAAHASG